MEYNYLGQPINCEPQLLDPSFGYYDKNAQLHINWAKEDEYVDAVGLAKSYKGTDGHYDVITLPRGKIIKRFGPLDGKSSTDLDEPYERLGLPYVPETIEYHELLVVRPLSVKVKSGIVYPMFFSPGGAVQYVHFIKIINEIKNGNLKEVTKWKI